MFSSPTPAPTVSPKPRPVSETTRRSFPSCACAVIITLPPSRCGSSPCLMAFSTSEGSMSGGKGVASRLSGTAMSNVRRLPMRICRMLR